MHRWDKRCGNCWRCDSVAVMVFACRRRRVLRIVAFIGVACFIFLCFQVFLVGFLDRDAHAELRRGARPKFSLDNDERRLADVSGGRTRTTDYQLQLQQKLERECRFRNCSIVTDTLVSTPRAISRSHVLSRTTRLPRQSFLNDSDRDKHIEQPQFRSVWEFLEHKFARPVFVQKNISEVDFMRGVNRRWQHLYKADDRMQFTCIISQVYATSAPMYHMSIIHVYNCQFIEFLHCTFETFCNHLMLVYQWIVNFLRNLCFADTHLHLIAIVSYKKESWFSLMLISNEWKPFYVDMYFYRLICFCIHRLLCCCLGKDSVCSG